MSRARPLYMALSARLATVIPGITARIRAEVPGYADLAYESHEIDVDMQLRHVVEGLLSNSTPSAAAIDHVRTVGRRRAAAGIALTDVIEAYHIAYREMWSQLLADAQHAQPAVREALTADVGLLWQWFHRLSAAVAEAHSSEIQAQRISTLALQRNLIGQLLGHTAFDDAVAAELGYRIGDEFLIACVADLTDRETELVGAGLEARGGVALCAGAGHRAVVVAQNIGVEELCSAVREAKPSARIGVGTPRRGLRGAADALRDATDALRRTGPGREVVEFADDWLMSSLSAVATRFDVLLAPGRAVAAEHPHLADAVRAYAASRYSVSGCARSLHIHANSAKYRLERWKELTGWDLESFTGLAASVIALELRPAAPPNASGIALVNRDLI